MSKVAFTTLLNRADSALSPHFGMAKWILVRDDDNGQITFEQNTVLNGRAVVEILVRHGCTDAVFTQIGEGAFHHLEQAGIRGWIGPAGTPVPQLLELLSRGELTRAQASEPKAMPTPARRGSGDGSAWTRFSRDGARPRTLLWAADMDTAKPTDPSDLEGGDICTRHHYCQSAHNSGRLLKKSLSSGGRGFSPGVKPQK